MTDTIEIYESDIEFYIKEFEEKHNLDMMTANQQQWNACLMFISRNMFQGDNRKRIIIKNSVNNRLNTLVLYKILDKYIELCNLYSKEISLNGYSKLLKIDFQTLLNWGNIDNKFNYDIDKIIKKIDIENIYMSNNSNNINICINNKYNIDNNNPNNIYSDIEMGEILSRTGFDIYTKLVRENEQSNADKLEFARSPIGIIAKLNHHHGWSSPYVSDSNKTKKSVSIEQLPDIKPLELSDNSQQ